MTINSYNRLLSYTYCLYGIHIIFTCLRHDSMKLYKIYNAIIPVKIQVIHGSYGWWRILMFILSNGESLLDGWQPFLQMVVWNIFGIFIHFIPNSFWKVIQFDEHVLHMGGSTTTQNLVPTFQGIPLQFFRCLSCEWKIAGTKRVAKSKKSTTNHGHSLKPTVRHWK